MYGINNAATCTGTFVTDVDNSFCMAELLQGVCAVNESGLGQPETVRQLRQAGFRGFLMGEHFMKAEDPGQELSKFIAAL